MVFNLVFASNTILSSFVFCSLNIDLYFLIPAVITQIFHPPVKLAMPIAQSTNEAKAEIKTHPMIVESKISKYMPVRKSCKLVCAFYSLNHFVLIL